MTRKRTVKTSEGTQKNARKKQSFLKKENKLMILINMSQEPLSLRT
jgi:hypothetical protein